MVIKKGETKKTTITLNEIEVAIAKYYGIRKHIIVPNVSWGFCWKDKDGWHSMHECDMFIIRKSGYAIEVEIKRTKSDLLNDFKKRHGHVSTKIREFYYAIPEEKADEWSKLIPEHAGIITYYKYVQDIWDRKKSRWTDKTKWVMGVKTMRKAKINKFSVKLTTEEQFKIARLGTLRIWNLKEKMIKNNGNFR